MNKHVYILGVDSDSGELRVARVRYREAVEISAEYYDTYEQAQAVLTKETVRTKEEILASLQLHLNEASRLTELLQEKIKQAIDGKKD